MVLRSELGKRETNDHANGGRPGLWRAPEQERPDAGTLQPRNAISQAGAGLCEIQLVREGNLGEPGQVPENSYCPCKGLSPRRENVESGDMTRDPLIAAIADLGFRRLGLDRTGCANKKRAIARRFGGRCPLDVQPYLNVFCTWHCPRCNYRVLRRRFPSPRHRRLGHHQQDAHTIFQAVPIALLSMA
jgi:hypothetical protein